MVKWISIAFAVAFGATFGVVASAAPGDLIYVHNADRVHITASQAGQVASWAVSVGAWDGSAADMLRVEIERDANSPTGFSAQVQGLKSAAAADLPELQNGVRVVGVKQ